MSNGNLAAKCGMLNLELRGGCVEATYALGGFDHLVVIVIDFQLK
jgi:hypothetical protein